uniref:Ig-like domain-containing protein n=1 Tax=Phasianus colchicus TaxID=9054 RepID=A0A669QLB1_PHACC
IRPPCLGKTFWPWLGQGQARTPEAEMSQREGSTFSIKCPYTAQSDKQLKAWCRMRNERCELVVLTHASIEYRYSDRARQGHITIQDDNGTVSITMSDLQAEDSGIYSCVYSSNYVPLKTILLNVYKAFFPIPHLVTHPGLLLQTSHTAKHCSCSGLALHFD